MIVAAYETHRVDSQIHLYRWYARIGNNLGRGWYEANIFLYQVWIKADTEQSFVLLSSHRNNAPIKMRICKNYSFYSEVYCPGIVHTGSWFKNKRFDLIYREISETSAQELGLFSGE